MTLIKLLPVVGSLLGLPLVSSLAVTPRGSAEHVLLFNCHNAANTYQYSTVGYWSGSPSGNPQAVVTSRTGATTVWEGAQASVTFSDGDVFTWNIPARVADGTYAGTAANLYTSFYCYNEWNTFSYYPNGDTCTVVYDCNHNAPQSTVPGDTTKIYYNLQSDYVQVPDGFGTSIHDILNNVFSKFDGNSGQTVDETAIDLGSGVSISFSGHGDIAGKTLTGLADILVNLIAGQSQMDVRWTSTEDYCKTYCATSVGSYCCDTETMTLYHRKIPHTVEVYAENTATNSDQGSLSYTITYNPPAADCTFMNLLGDALGAAALVGGDFGTLLGAMASGTGFVNHITGC